ncbi:MAG: alpha/beta fold hydrolase [Rubrivivax sp.]|jgi:pimeloyl-ACP methyl ester carboxylesterase|nr:alpha/beta fold hydrolase [Rubrivivax sp.]
MKVRAGAVDIEVDDRGSRDGQPLLLIMGLGMQLVGWPEELVEMLVDSGFRVVRFDNRDAGLSQGFDHLGVPNLALAGIRYALRLPVRAPYRLADMAADAAGVLDALGIVSAHVCGASMGGMIAQHLAASFPARVRSLVLMMSTSGARHLPQPSLAIRRALLSRPDGSDTEAVVRHLRRLLGVIGSPGYPPEPMRFDRRLRETVQRAWRPAGTARQICAVMADGDRTPLLGAIRAPCAVIHGADDPLVPAEAGRELARRIDGATLDLVPGMGHDLPLELLPRFAATIAATARRPG